MKNLLKYAGEKASDVVPFVDYTTSGFRLKDISQLSLTSAEDIKTEQDSFLCVNHVDLAAYLSKLYQARAGNDPELNDD